MVIACVFLIAAVGKARSLSLTRHQVAAYEILPPRLTGLAVWLIILAEAMSSVAIMVPITRRIGALGAFTLLVVFLAAQARAVALGKAIDCGCFGGSTEVDRVGAASLVRTGLLLGMAGVPLVAPASSLTFMSAILALELAAVIFLFAEVIRLMTYDVSASIRR